RHTAMLRSLALAIPLAIAGPAFAGFEPQQPIQIRPNPFGGGYNVQQFGHPTRRFVPPPLAAGTRFSSSATPRSRAAQTLSAAEGTATNHYLTPPPPGGLAPPGLPPPPPPAPH